MQFDAANNGATNPNVINTDCYGNATDVDYEAGEAIADVLLEVEGVQVNEIVGGKRTASVTCGDLMILSMMPTREELELVNAQLHLPPGTISSDADATGKPFVFILVGSYKLPLGPFIPCLQFDRYTFNFVVGISFIEITFPKTTVSEDLDAFPFIVGTYGAIRVHPKFQKEAFGQTSRIKSRVSVLADPVSEPRSSLATAQQDRSADAVSSPNALNTYGGPQIGMGGGAASSPYSYGYGGGPVQYTTSSSSAAVGGNSMAMMSPSGGTNNDSVYSNGGYNNKNGAGQLVPIAGGGGGGGANTLSSSVFSPTASMRQASSPITSKIVSGITGVGRIVGAVIVTGSAIIAGGIGVGANLFVSKTRPCERALNVPPKIKNRLEMTRKLTKGAAVVSGAMATSAIGVAAVVGNVIGSNASEMLIGDGTNPEENPKGRAVMEVGSALFSTGVLVIASLSTAKHQLLTATGENITKMVTHKLGAEAGAASDNAMGIVHDAVNATVGLKGGVKRKIAVAAAKTAMSHQEGLQQQHMEQQTNALLQQHAQYHSGPATTTGNGYVGYQ